MGRKSATIHAYAMARMQSPSTGRGYGVDNGVPHWSKLHRSVAGSSTSRSSGIISAGSIFFAVQECRSTNRYTSQAMERI